MPSKTPKQKSFMAAVANNPKFAKKVGVSQQVGKEFEMKDKKKPVKKLAFGGMGGAKMNTAPTLGSGTKPAGNSSLGRAIGAAAPAQAAKPPISPLNQRIQASKAAEQQRFSSAPQPVAAPARPVGPSTSPLYQRIQASKAAEDAKFNSIPQSAGQASQIAALNKQLQQQGRPGMLGSTPAQMQQELNRAPAQGGIGRALGAAAAQPQQTPSPQQLQKMQQSLSGLGGLGRGNSQQVDPGGRIPTPGGAAQGFADLQQQQNMGRNAPTLGRYAKGGKVKQADGIAKKGKTATKMVKMAKGGSVSARADGIATKGKTNCKMPGMAKGGYAKGGRGCK